MAKILLVEDNKDISENIKEYLELEWYTVTQAFDGEVGIEKATKGDFDLILLDLMLPEVDGISIARRVVAKKWTPIIMITARESVGDRLLGFETWAVDYLVKPFDLRELHARVMVHLQKWSVWSAIFSDEIRLFSVVLHVPQDSWWKNNTVFSDSPIKLSSYSAKPWAKIIGSSTTLWTTCSAGVLASLATGIVAWVFSEVLVTPQEANNTTISIALDNITTFFICFILKINKHLHNIEKSLRET